MIYNLITEKDIVFISYIRLVIFYIPLYSRSLKVLIILFYFSSYKFKILNNKSRRPPPYEVFFTYFPNTLIDSSSITSKQLAYYMI